MTEWKRFQDEARLGLCSSAFVDYASTVKRWPHLTVANLFISLSGEGRGHATRARALVEALRSEHQIRIFTSGDALRFLEPLYQGSEVRVTEVPGLRFHYTAKHCLHFSKTGLAAAGFVRGLPEAMGKVARLVEAERPDLVIADFEPVLPRVAKRMGVPFVSVDHQHFLTTYDLSSLPTLLRMRARFISLVVKAYFSGEREAVVSSFFFPPLRRSAKNTTQVGVMLRPQILAAPRSYDGHLVAYWRRGVSPHVLEALRQTGREVRVYGLGAMPAVGNVKFFEVNEERFIADLSTCDALVSTAGNQLVGEALFMGKAVFVAPEEKNFEQYINAHFLAQSGSGQWCEMRDFSGERLKGFLSKLETFRASIVSPRLNGLPATLAVISRLLPGRGATADNRRVSPVALAA